MRVDKFLKVSRLIKRRTVAKDVSDQGRVLINGREAKPSSTVKLGDEITVQFGQKLVTVRVERLTETTRKDGRPASTPWSRKNRSLKIADWTGKRPKPFHQTSLTPYGVGRLYLSWMYKPLETPALFCPLAFVAASRSFLKRLFFFRF